MLALLFLAAAIVQPTPVDARISHPWVLTVSLDVPGKQASHTEAYRSLESCQAEEKQLIEAVGSIPQITITPCNYVGLV